MEKRHYEALIKQPCVYCGHKTGHIGVDRVCNDQSYTTENTAACCTVCNFMKRDLGLRAFVRAARNISKGPMARNFSAVVTTEARATRRPASHHLG